MGYITFGRKGKNKEQSLIIKLSSLYHLLRVKHWVKNTFVFIPAFFSGDFHANIWTLVMAFFAFSFVASSVYIFNDINDVEYDKQNKLKRNIFATEKGSKKVGFILVLLFLLLGVGIGVFLGDFYILPLYFLINVFYTLVLKKVPYLEMLCVVSGFVLRIQFGGAITSIDITYWLYIETIILTMLIILSKRIKEMNHYKTTNILSREVLKKYRINRLKRFFAFLNLLILAIYVFYCFDQSVQLRTHEYIWITIPFVIFGLYRFLKHTFEGDIDTNPVNILFKDKMLLLVVFCWITTWGYLIYE